MVKYVYNLVWNICYKEFIEKLKIFKNSNHFWMIAQIAKDKCSIVKCKYIVKFQVKNIKYFTMLRRIMYKPNAQK